MRLHTYRIERKMATLATAIANVRANSDLQAALATVGVSSAQIDQGASYHQAALDAIARQEACEHSFALVRNQRKERRQALKQQLQADILSAKFALRDDPELRASLNLKGRTYYDRRVVPMAGKLYRQLSELLTSDKADLLINQGLSAERIAAGSALYQAAQACEDEYLRLSAERQDATDQRNRAISDANLWYTALVRRTRLALRRQPQLLEAFGVTV